MGPRKVPAIQGVLEGAIKTSASSFEETARAKEKIEVLSAAAAARASAPQSPPLRKSSRPSDTKSQKKKQKNQKPSSGSGHPHVAVLLPLPGGDPSSPHAIIRVGLVVFHPHIILLGSGGPFFGGLGVGPGEHVLSHMEGCMQHRKGQVRSNPALPAAPAMSSCSGHGGPRTRTSITFGRLRHQAHLHGHRECILPTHSTELHAPLSFPH